MEKKKVNRAVTLNDNRNNKIIIMQRTNDIISMLLEGRETKEIIPYIASKYRLTPLTARKEINEARGEIKKRHAFQVDSLISIHILRYEYIYKELYSLGMYGDAASVLEAKEKLLGFHREGFHMKINHGHIQQVSLMNVSNEYNINKLEDKKRERFDYLLNKIKKDDAGGDAKAIQ